MNDLDFICEELKTTTLRDSSTKEMKTPNASIYMSSGERMSCFPFQRNTHILQ